MSDRSSILSSPPLSVASRSPSLPAAFRPLPSPPPSSNASDVSSLLSDPPESMPDLDGPPPAKKRKVSPPAELKTEYLDLEALNASSDGALHRLHDPKLDKLKKILRTKKRIVIIAGAGISVSAGIPDFRSSTGLFTTLKSQHKLKASGKHLFDASVYRDDSSTSSFHDMVRELSHQSKNAEPTPFHHMVARLAEEGRLMRLYTQNVDCLDVGMEPLATTVPLNEKGPWPKSIQLHGGLGKMVCSMCKHLSEFDGALFEGPEAPSCKECEERDSLRAISNMRSHGIGRLRPRMVLYNEHNPDEDAIGAVSHADLKKAPDAVIVVGTSLKIPGVRRLAKEMCAVTRGRRGGFTAWINLDPEPLGADFKETWDLVIRGKSDDIARQVALPHWDDKNPGEYVILSKEEHKLAKGEFAVVLESNPSLASGIITPGASPRRQPSLPFEGLGPSKQTKLSFGKPALAAGAPGKVKKPRKKPAASKAAPRGKITNAFTNMKTTKPAATKSSKPAKGMDSQGPDSSAFFARSFQPQAPPAKHQDSSKLGPVSSQDHRVNSDPADSHHTGQKSASGRVPLPSGPKSKTSKTPATPTAVPYDRAATISPTSTPRGMENLLS